MAWFSAILSASTTPDGEDDVAGSGPTGVGQEEDP